MDFTLVLLVCLAGIALCSMFVFAVETVVAFWLHDREEVRTVVGPVLRMDRMQHEMTDKAA